MKSLMEHLGLYLEDSKSTSTLLTLPRTKDTGTAEETVAKLLKTNTATQEAQKEAEYYRGEVEKAEKDGDDKVPQAILEKLRKALAEAEKAAVKKIEDNEVVLDNMRAVRSKLKAAETTRLCKETENKEKAALRAKARKDGLEAFRLAVTKRIAEHLLVEEQTEATWSLHHTALATRASEELELVDAQILKAEAAASGTKPATASTTVGPASDATMEPGKGTPTVAVSQFEDSAILKALQEQMSALQGQMTRQQEEAKSALDTITSELMAVQLQRTQEVGFLRSEDEVTADTFKVSSNSPPEHGKDAMIRSHQVLSQWSAAGANCMFTMRHLDEWAGLKGETRFLLEHLMGNTKAPEKSWMVWFPQKPTDDTIVPRQMARIMMQLLSKSRKAWEQGDERSKEIRIEADEIFTTLAKDGKRRCIGVTNA